MTPRWTQDSRANVGQEGSSEMCAHKVIGMSVIALACSAVIANTSVMIGPETKVISATNGDASRSDCAPRIVHTHMWLQPAREQAMRDLIVGKWLGETAAGNGRSQRFLAQHFPDGRFSVTYLTREPDGREHVDVYAGEWGISGPIYFTAVTGRDDEVAAHDPGKPGKYNAYEVLNVDDESFEYESLSPREQFAARRVGEGFRPEDL